MSVHPRAVFSDQEDGLHGASDTIVKHVSGSRLHGGYKQVVKTRPASA